MSRWGFLVVLAALFAAGSLLRRWFTYMEGRSLRPWMQAAIGAGVIVCGASAGALGLVISSRYLVRGTAADWGYAASLFVIGVTWMVGGNMLIYAFLPGLYGRPK